MKINVAKNKGMKYIGSVIKRDYPRRNYPLGIERKNMRIRQNSDGSWRATQDGRVIGLEDTLPQLFMQVKPVVGDDLPTPFYEQVLAEGGLDALIREARASMDRAAMTRAAMGRAESGV
jgi:hypothetical protein